MYHTYLWRSLQNGVKSQIPNILVIDLGDVCRNLDIDSIGCTRDVVCNLDLLVVLEVVAVADRVVIQPNTVLSSRVFGQWVTAVDSRFTIEAKVNGLTLSHSRVLGDALIDIHAGVIPLSPGYTKLATPS